MDAQTGFADIDAARLYYETAGCGEALVFIHGFGLDTRMWDVQFETFAPHFRVVRYDMRGFGRSSLPDGAYSAAADLRALLAHLDIEHAHIVGLSLGGWVAANFAVAYPQAVRRLVFADAVVLGVEWSQEYLDEMNPVWAAASEQGVEAAKALILQSRLYSGALSDPQAAPRVAQMMADFSGWHFQNTDPGQSQPDVLEKLPGIAAPALVLVGEHDYPDFHHCADLLAAIPDSRKVVLPGVGHLTNLEAPAHFDELVLEFLTAN